MYAISFSSQAKHDFKIAKKSPYYKQIKALLGLIQQNPYQEPPLFEPLVGSKKYARRINLQHRLIYQIIEEEKIIKILSCWTHYHE